MSIRLPDARFPVQDRSFAPCISLNIEGSVRSSAHSRFACCQCGLALLRNKSGKVLDHLLCGILIVGLAGIASGERSLFERIALVTGQLAVYSKQLDVTRHLVGA